MVPFLPAAALFLAIAFSQHAAVSERNFGAADDATKVRMLARIYEAGANVAIDDAIVLVRAGLRDPSVTVRATALAAVAGRVLASHWAGTTGPAVGPSPAGPPPKQPVTPAEWKGDQQRLRDALENDCLAVLKTDPDDEVRDYALLAILSLEGPERSDGGLPAWLVQFVVDLYRRDRSSRIRAHVVRTFRLAPNDTPEMRAVLRDALVDGDASVRYEALTGITPQATPDPSRRLSFAEARDTLAAALKDPNPGVRLGAVQALNVFGAPAAPFVDILERLSRTDPDDHVRASSRLAIEAIERALAGRGGR